MTSPVVSIGLPVYNGDAYLEEAIESILSQSFGNFELVICDNGSTDYTPEIAADFARRDDRIRIHTLSHNVGAAANFNLAFRLAQGFYFKWASYDDVLTRDYLLRCVRAFESDPSLALAYGSARLIAEDGTDMGSYRDPLRAHASTVARRYHQLLWSLDRCFAVFGLYRSDVLRRTNLIRPHKGSDRSLLAEVSLLGPICRIDDELIWMRQSRSVREGRDASWWAPVSEAQYKSKVWALTRDVVGDCWNSDLSLGIRVALASDGLVSLHTRNWKRVLYDAREILRARTVAK